MRVEETDSNDNEQCLIMKSTNESIDVGSYYFFDDFVKLKN